MCKFDKQYIVEELKKKLGYGWHVYPVNIYQKSTKNFTNPISYNGPVYCVHCKSKNIAEVHTDEYGTVSGGATEWVYKCFDCNKYMTVGHEWG